MLLNNTVAFLGTSFSSLWIIGALCPFPTCWLSLPSFSSQCIYIARSIFHNVLFLLLFTPFLCLRLVFKKSGCSLEQHLFVTHTFQLWGWKTLSTTNILRLHCNMSKPCVCKQNLHMHICISNIDQFFRIPKWVDITHSPRCCLCWPSLPGILEDKTHPWLCRAGWAQCQDGRPKYVEDERAQMLLVSAHHKHSACGIII